VARSSGRIIARLRSRTELVAVTAGPFYAPRRGHSGQDDLLDAVLAEVGVEVGVREPALPPVLARHDVTVSRGEVRVPLAAPGSCLEHPPVADRAGGAAGPQPSFEVAGAPAAVWGDDDLDARRAHGGQQFAGVLVQGDGLGDVLQPGVDLPALAEEVVIRVDDNERDPGAL
jgi:hypothetical protein